MAVVRIILAQTPTAQEALAELVRLLARQAAAEHYARLRDSRAAEAVKQ
jgi:hypothetical protein